MKRTFGRAFEVSVMDALGLYVGVTTVFRLLGFRIWVEVWVCV